MTSNGIFSEGIGPGFVYMAFRAGAFIAEKTPLRVSDAVARFGGMVAFLVARRKRDVIGKNLARVVGEGAHLDGVVRAAFISYAEYWLETFRLGRYSKADLLKMVTIDDEGRAALLGALQEGRGVVLATGHIGFYDLGVAWFGANGWPFTTVAEVLRPRALFEWFAGIRTARGMSVIPAKPGSEARQRLQELVRGGEGVAILSDRDISRRGIWGELFGEATTFPAGPSLIVVKTEAPLLAGAIFKTGRSEFRVVFERVPYQLCGDEQQDIRHVSGLIADRLEALIRRAPEQWHLFSTNWPSDEPHLPSRGKASA